MLEININCIYASTYRREQKQLHTGRGNLFYVTDLNLLVPSILSSKDQTNSFCNGVRFIHTSTCKEFMTVAMKTTIVSCK